MLATTDAIVLRSRKHSDTSKIVTLYTRDHGKLDVIAKGARDIRSKFGGAIETFAETRAVFYKKEKREAGLYLLSKAELLHSNAKLIASLEHMEAATSVIELVNRSMHDEEENSALYELVRRVLSAMDAESEPLVLNALLVFFYLQFAEQLGFRVRVEAISATAHVRSRTIFRVRSGEIIRVVLSDEPDNNRFDEVLLDGIPTLEGSHRALLALSGASLDRARALKISEHTMTNLKEIFRAFFIEHIPGVSKNTMRSAGVFGRMG